MCIRDSTIAEARALIYTAGAYPRKAGVPGEDEYTGKGVSYCAICDGAFYKGKKMCIRDRISFFHIKIL